MRTKALFRSEQDSFPRTCTAMQCRNLSKSWFITLFEIKVNIKHKSLELKGQSYEKKFQSELGVRFNFRANVSMARSNFVGALRLFSSFSLKIGGI